MQVWGILGFKKAQRNSLRNKSDIGHDKSRKLKFFTVSVRLCWLVPKIGNRGFKIENSSESMIKIDKIKKTEK